MAIAWASVVRILIVIAIAVVFIAACFTLPIEKVLNDFLIWIDRSLGKWGPLVLAVAYIPLTVLAVPASILTLGGGYLYGLPIGFIADSIGSTAGAAAAFYVGKMVGRSYVLSKLKDYPQFDAIVTATERSAFKPITFVLVYIGTTIKDLSDVTHGWREISLSNWIFLSLSIIATVVIMILVTRVAKNSLNEALVDKEDVTECSPVSTLHTPLLIEVENTVIKIEDPSL